MSVRSRIEAFEELSKNQPDTENKNNANTKKRFHYPGPNRRSNTDHQQSNNFSTSRPAKTQGLADFESDLQEVWSVRKNIHHQGSKQSSTSSTSTSVPTLQTTGHYSRHRAIAAQQSYGSPVLAKNNKEPVPKSHVNSYAHNDDEFSFESKRAPLQEQNSPWNIKKTNYSYNSSEVPNKRPVDSPSPLNGVGSPPTAKRKPNHGEASLVRPTKATDLMFPTRQKPDEKVNYAKRMANSYLRSVGIGEFTPPDPGNKKQLEKLKQSTSQWRNSERF